MTGRTRATIRKATAALLAALSLTLAGAPAAAQITQVDPNAVPAQVDEAPGDAQPVYGQPVGTPSAPPQTPAATPVGEEAASQPGFETPVTTPAGQPGETVAPEWNDPGPPLDARQAASDANTYAKDDVLGAAEEVFGKGAEGLAKLIEDLLEKQGEPNAYIVGNEGGGALVFGARYGKGMLYHKVEGERKVYWTGPSVGFDAGANAGKTFTLVYNLWDTEDLYERFPAGEGAAYLVGGFNASYVRRGDIVLIPVRVGAGVRLGVNAGYLRFSKKRRWLPF